LHATFTKRGATAKILKELSAEVKLKKHDEVKWHYGA